MTYLEKLKALREDNDYPQKKIAGILRVAQSTYSQYERGVLSLPIEYFKILCEFYGVSADEILGVQKRREEPFGR